MIMSYWNQGLIRSTSRILSAAADTNATSAKASPGTLYSVKGFNAAGAARYLKFYDKASAPTVGTDTPVLTIYLPASTAYGMVTAGADNSTAALTAGDVLALNVEYA
jgi:hypothetical protein